MEWTNISFLNPLLCRLPIADRQWCDTLKLTFIRPFRSHCMLAVALWWFSKRCVFRISCGVCCQHEGRTRCRSSDSGVDLWERCSAGARTLARDWLVIGFTTAYFVFFHWISLLVPYIFALYSILSTITSLCRFVVDIYFLYSLTVVCALSGSFAGRAEWARLPRQEGCGGSWGAEAAAQGTRGASISLFWYLSNRFDRLAQFVFIEESNEMLTSLDARMGIF